MGCINASKLPSQPRANLIQIQKTQINQQITPIKEITPVIQTNDNYPTVHTTIQEYRQQIKLPRKTGRAGPIIRKIESFDSQLLNQTKANCFDQHVRSQKHIQNNETNIKEKPSQITSNVNVPITKKKVIEIEVRDQQILIDLPAINQNGKVNESELKRWITKLAQVVFSSAFHYYYEQKMTFDQTKIYCSQNVMKNIVLLNESCPISAQEFQMMDKHLKQCSLNYINMKYPLTENVEVCKDLAKLVVEIDKMESIDNNEVANEKIDFEYRESQNYNDLIMKMLNKMIRKVTHFEKEGQVTIEDEQMLHLFNKFEQKITNLFQKIQDQDWCNGFCRITSQKEKNQKKEKYKTAIKQYTHYQIGRKIPEIVAPYPEEEIESGDLTIKHPSILRILTKWCEQLWNQFKEQSYYESRSQNLMIQKLHEIRYVYPHFRPILDKELQNEKVRILDYMIQKLKKNSSMQVQLLQSQRFFEDVNRYLDEIDQITGKFTLNMVDNLHHLIVLYLNRLIHGLLSVAKTFMKTLDKESFSVEWPYPPNLISFRIGDLIRCKLSSKEKEIIAIYNEIQRISSQQSEDLKIVRIKNRLKKNTNDILINVRFKDTILCEIQLAIKVKTSEFLKCSNSFQHFIYQLIRSHFGPITELCSIRQSLDKRCDIYKNLIKNQQLKKKSVHSCKQNKTEFKMNSYNQDFICDNCSYIYYDDNYATDHQECIQCGYILCALCRIKMTPIQSFEKIIDFSQQYQKYIYERIYDLKKITSGNYYCLLNIKSKKIKPLLFLVYEYKQFNYWISKNNEGVIYQIYNSDSDREKLLKEKVIIFSCYEGNFQSSMLIQPSQAIIKYIRKKIISDSFCKEKQTIQIEMAKLRNVECQELLNIATLRQKQNVKNLLLGFNQLNELPFNPEEFPNLIWLGLNRNPLRTISDNMILNKNLRTIILQACQLSEFPKCLFKMPWLKRLSFYQDRIQTISEQISEMKNLADLQIESCGFTTLPENIGKCINLERLSLQKNQLQKLPNSICELINLKFLNLFKNNLRTLPENIGKLSKLRQLRLQINPLKQLPISFWNLQDLKKLYLFKTQINKLQQLQKLTQLQDLQINETNLKSAPSSISQLSKLAQIKLINYKDVIFSKEVSNMTSLRSIQIQSCEEVKIPKSFMKLNLEKVNIYDNNDLDLPDQVFQKMSTLKNLNLQNNKIMNFPELDNSKNLIVLNLSKNKIKIIPELNHLKSLQNLDLSNNCIQRIQDKLLKLKQLKCLDLSNNQLKQIISTTVMTSSLRQSPKITQINLCNNFLQCIPFILRSCKSLRHLSLQNNLINKASEEDLFISSLTELSINTIQYQQIPNNFKSVMGQFRYIPIQWIKKRASLTPQEESQQKYTYIPSVNKPNCWKCLQLLSFPYYWLKWEEDELTFGCPECVQEKIYSKNQNQPYVNEEQNKAIINHHYKYQKNSILLLKPYKRKILKANLGKNIQPWDKQNPQPKKHKKMSCDNCENHYFDLGDPRYICLGCGLKGKSYVDLCQECLQQLKIEGQDEGQNIRPEVHSDDHHWLRVLYYSGTYLEF